MLQSSSVLPFWKPQNVRIILEITKSWNHSQNCLDASEQNFRLQACLSACQFSTTALRGEQASAEASLLYHQKYVAAAATSISIALRSVQKMTEDLERAEEEEDWENEGLDESAKVVRKLRRLRDTKDSVTRVLRDTALPTAAFGVKFLAKIFGDLTLSKSKFLIIICWW